MKKTSTSQSKFVYRYHNIYKNLIRDVKIYFREKFDAAKADLKQRYRDELDLNFNYPLAEAMFQTVLVQFVLGTFDHEMVKILDEESPTRLLRGLCFKFGSFIIPKSMLQRFKKPEGLSDRFKGRIQTALDFLVEAKQGDQLLDIITRDSFKNKVPGHHQMAAETA